MSGKCRPSLRAKTLSNVLRSNLSETDKECIRAIFEREQKQEKVIEMLWERIAILKEHYYREGKFL